MSETIFTTYLVDDDPSVLKALARLLRAAGYNPECFASPHKFLAAHDPSIPGCAVIDLAMSEIDGLELQARLIRSGSERPIVFLTGNGDIPASVQAMKAGAIDFLTKPVNREELLAAIARAVDMDARSRQKRADLQSINGRLATLTRREQEVLRHVVGGQLNKQIAAALGTVEKTIKVHRGRVMTKLGVRCVADLVRLTERAGIAPEH
ncbi:MAG: response regulator transcription factor [Pseudolabrys sp.]